MIKTKRAPQNVIHEEDYKLPTENRNKLIAVLFGLFFAGFVLNFPLMELVKGKIMHTLTHLPGCRLQLKEVNFGILLPRVNLKNISIPGSCLGSGGKELYFEDIALYFRGPSFSPLGVAFKIETEYQGIPLAIHTAIGPSKQLLKIDESDVALEELSSLIKGFKLAGQAEVNAVVRLNKFQLSSVNAKIKSTNFALPAQDVMGFVLPNMNIKNVVLKISQKKKNKISVDQLSVGDVNSPIRANFAGEILPNKFNFVLSRLNLRGELALGKDLLQEFFIIKQFLDAYPKKDEFYQMSLSGTIGQPVPKPL
jgi:type II secretion system protein N